jgi:hypothetical protein
MSVDIPVLIKQRQIDDDELRKMLRAAEKTGDTNDFFRHFSYDGEPHQTLSFGQALLGKCSSLEPEIYKLLHKGTPFYWLARAAFLVHDYETAAFYIDAAVSEDLRVDPTKKNTPARLFFNIDDSVPEQAARDLVALLRTRIDDVIVKYNRRTDACLPALSFGDIRQKLLEPATLPGNEHLRTLVTTFISFILEWHHRSMLIELRPQAGTAEPFFIHLFKGCLLFESLLKVKASNRGKKLEAFLKELSAKFGFAGCQIKITAGDFQLIINDLAKDDGTVYTAVVRTGCIRNTTGHNLGWQVALNPAAYNALAESVVVSCLHTLACLYR